MSHFRIDTVKYQRHLEMRTTHYAAAERLLETIGSVPRVQRAVREATATGRLTDSMAEHVDSLLLFLAEYSCPGTLDRPEPAIEPDEASLHELIDHLHQCFELMRFSNFVIPPGCIDGIRQDPRHTLGNAAVNAVKRFNAAQKPAPLLMHQRLAP